MAANKTTRWLSPEKSRNPSVVQSKSRRIRQTISVLGTNSLRATFSSLRRCSGDQQHRREGGPCSWEAARAMPARSVNAVVALGP